MKRYLAATVAALCIAGTTTTTDAHASAQIDADRIVGFHDGQQARGAITGCKQPNAIWLEATFRGILRVGMEDGPSREYSSYYFGHMALEIFNDDTVTGWYFEKAQDNFNDRYALSWVNVVCADTHDNVLFERSYHKGDDNRGGGCDGNHCSPRRVRPLPFDSSN